MSKVLIEEQKLQDIADSIRAKNGSQDKYTPGEMSEAIEKIEGINDYYETLVEIPHVGVGSIESWVNKNYIKKIPTVVISDNITRLSRFYYNATVFPQIKFNKNVTSIAELFCPVGMYTSNIPVTEVNTSLWDTSNLQEITGVFCMCRSLPTVDVSNWNTSKVTDFSSIFYNCSGLTSIDVTNWDTSNLTACHSLFGGCTVLSTIDIHNFDLSKIKADEQWGSSLVSIFSGCYNLENLTFGTGYGLGFNQNTVANYATLNLSASSKLTHDSLMDVINKLADVTGSGIVPQLQIGSTNLAKLTAGEIAIATNKGWTIS